jgi:hypothetical protein
MERGQGAAALGDLEAARQLAPRDPDVWLALGDLRRATARVPVVGFQLRLDDDRQPAVRTSAGNIPEGLWIGSGRL